MRAKLIFALMLFATAGVAGYMIGPSTAMPPATRNNQPSTSMPTPIRPATSLASVAAPVVPDPTMDVVAGSSLDNVGNTLVINGVSMTLVAEYDARDATLSSWPARTSGATASIAGSGVAPTLDTPAPTTDGTGEEAVLFANDGSLTGSGQYYATANGALTIGTDDIVVEAVVRSSYTAPGTDRALFGNLSSATGRGWGVFYRSSQGYAFSADDDGSGVCFPSGAITNVQNSSFDVIHYTFDRSVGIRGYRNGVLVTASACTTAATSAIDQVTVPFAIGAYGTLPLGGGSGVAKLRFWKCAGCISTTGELDTMAFDRASKITGVIADVVASGSQLPTTADRAGYATMPIFDGTAMRQFSVGNAWMRVASTSATLKGFFLEPQTTNLFLRGEEISNASWTKPTAGDAVSANVALSPQNDFSGDSFDAATDAVGVEHCARQAVTLTAAPYTASVFLKAGTNTFAYLRNGTIANGVAWVNLSTCAAGTVQAGVTATARQYTNGWCRFSTTFTGTAASHTIDVCGASADGSLVYTEPAGSTVDWSVWGAQIEQGVYPTSQIRTAAATVTRTGDDFRHSGASIASTATGTYAADLSFPYGVSTTTRIPWIVDAAGSGANFVEHIHASSLLGAAGSGGLSIAGSSAIDDGATHEIRLIVAANNTRNFVDGAAAGTDTSHTLPTGIDTLEIGNDVGTTTSGNSGALVSRFRYWTTEVLP